MVVKGKSSPLVGMTRGGNRPSGGNTRSSGLLQEMRTHLQDMMCLQNNEHCDTFSELQLKPPKHRVRNPYQRKSHCAKMKKDKMQMQNITLEPKMTFANEWESDAVWIGDDFQHKCKKVTRFWLQNPNGISAKCGFQTFRGDIEDMMNAEVDFVALPETKLNSNNKYVKEKLHIMVENHCSNGKLCVTNTKSFCKDACNQPGGVATIAQGNLSGRYAGAGCDSLGRYTWMKFCGRRKTLKIYTFYRVSQNSGTNLGDTTAYNQQYVALNEESIEKMKALPKEQRSKIRMKNPRQHVLETLCADLKKDVLAGCAVVLLGDLNENIVDANFNHDLEDIGIVNVLKNKLSDGIKNVRSHNRGKSIIDGIWTSEHLLGSIQKVGVAPFYTMCASDHRGIYMDVDLRSVLDNPVIEFQQMNARRLQSTIPKRVQEYVNKIEFYWRHRKVGEKIALLKDQVKTHKWENLEMQLNHIDSQIGEILVAAEKGCTQVNKNAIHDWSPILSATIKEERDCVKRVQKLKRCSLDENLVVKSKELQQALLELKVVRKKAKEIKQNSRDHRKTHLDELIQMNLEKDGKKNYAGELKRLQNIEKQRIQARILKRSHIVPRKAGIREIYVPDPSEYTSVKDKEKYMNIDVIWEKLKIANGKDVTKWELVEDQSEVERLTMECMMKHFGQADGTPLTSLKWNRRLVDDDFVTRIKNEDYSDLENETEAIREYFQAMGTIKNTVELNPFLYTFEDWKNYIRNVKERTTTSPAGRHYGHFKVLLEHCPMVFEGIFEIMNMAFQQGILLERWKKTVTVLIPKDEGIIKIHRLRPLHIVEPEITAMAKGLWAKKLTRIAEKLGNITDDQYGGRKNRQAQSAVLNKIMYYNINRMTMTETEYDDIDMKSNYDRELARLVATEARVKLGMNKQDAQFLVNFVEHQKFYVKTAYGVSEKWYEYEEKNKLYGLGQGIAWSGPGWIASSDTLAKSKLKSCVGMKFESPISKLTVNKQQDFFVDDTTSGCNQCGATANCVMEQAQVNLQKHSDYVEVTGGQVAADKSHYCHVKWEFKNGVSVPVDNDMEPSNMFLQQGDGICRTIKKMPLRKEHKTLGCWVNPLGEKVDAYKQILQFVKQWKKRMLGAQLSPELIRKSYESELKPQLRYRLPVYDFTEEECNDIMKIINPIILNAHYVNKNYPRSLLQANDQYGGLGIDHIYDIMCTEKLKFLFMHMRRWDTTGKLMLIAMQNTQLECGSETIFFNLDYQHWGSLVTPTWHTHLWKYCDMKALNIDIHKTLVYEKPREQDEFLMDVLQRSGKFNSEQLQHLNKVRQKLQVLTLSDIADLRGKRLLQGVKHSSDIEHVRVSSIKFLPQAPLPSWWNLWKDEACPFLEYYLSKHPLGAWKKKSHQRWKWRISSDKKYLSKDDELYLKCGSIYVCDKQQETQTLYTDWRRVDVGFTKKKMPYIVAHDYQHDVGEYEKEQNIPERWGQIEYVIDKKECLNHIKTGKILLATDGSNKFDEGVQGWLITDLKGKVMVKGRGRIQCARADASSLRPELMAILAVTTFVKQVWESEKTQTSSSEKPKIKLYTDSENAILCLRETLYPTTKNVFENNMDAKLEVKNVLRSSPVQFNLIHVYAHQDDQVEFDDLPLEAQLNCLVDEYVGELYEQDDCGIHEEMCDFLHEQVCSIRLPFTRPTSNILEQIVAFGVGHKSEKQLATFWNTPQDRMCNIDWKGFRSAVRREKGNKKSTICKLVHKQWPTMFMMQRNGMSTTDVCPLCLKEVETWKHVFQCKCEDAKIERNNQLNILQKKLKNYFTHPVLRQRLMAAIMQWMGGYVVTVPQKDATYVKINEAFRDQCSLNFENLMCGVLSYKFEEVQQAYCHENRDVIPRRYLNTGGWVIKVIRALLAFSVSVWENRCEVVHQGNKLSLENQVRATALKLRKHLRNHPWEMRIEDGHLLKRKEPFFSKAPLLNLKLWIQRINVSREIALNHEQTTRQDIRRWIDLPEHPIGKRVKNYTQKIMKTSKKSVKQKKLEEYWKGQCQTQTLPVLCDDVQYDDVDSESRNEEVVEELSFWDDIRSARAFDEYEIETEGGKPMQVECPEHTQSIGDFENEHQSPEKGKGEIEDIVYKASGKDYDSIPPLSVVQCTHIEDETCLHEDVNLGLEDVVRTHATRRISTVQHTKDARDQLPIDIKKMKKRSWWENINNWFVKKINSNQKRRSDDNDSEKNDDIIFLEDSNLPLHTETCEQTELQEEDEWEKELRLEKLAMSTQKTNESLIYESFGSTSTSESEIRIGIQETQMNLDAYIDMHQNGKSMKRKKMLRKLIHSWSQQSTCEEAMVLSLFPTSPLMMRVSGDDESSESWTCEEAECRKAIRSEKVKAILKDIESCGTSNESSEASYQICELEEISLNENNLEKLSFHDESYCPIIRSGEDNVIGSCERRLTQQEVLSNSFHMQPRSCSAKIPEEIYIVNTLSSLKRPQSNKIVWNDVEAFGTTKNERNSLNMDQYGQTTLTTTKRSPGSIKTPSRNHAMIPKGIVTSRRNIKQGRIKHRDKQPSKIEWKEASKKNNMDTLRCRIRQQVETVREGSGGKVAKKICGFFNQVTEIDEVYLRQSKNKNVANKARDRDHFTGSKHQANNSGVIHQAHSRQNGQAGCAGKYSHDDNLSYQNHDRSHSASLSAHLTNDENIKNKSYLSLQRLSGGKQIQNLIGSDGKVKFSEVGCLMESVSLTSDLTSVDREDTGLNQEKCELRITGLIDENDRVKYLSLNGNQDVDPTTYPTGRPKKYFESLNKNNVES